MRLVISGGGTGGHIYPALALIEALKAEGKLDDVLYVGTKRGLESRIVPATGLKFATLDLQGFKRSLSLSNFTTVRKFLGSLGEAKNCYRIFNLILWLVPVAMFPVPSYLPRHDCIFQL
ncbi:UDP-N-acetylglucosamine--N-acetylmuramyl-(pentapeptide) pyrophosphoryl-undecaprenol N-acetylglucosamine transferase [Lacticaseibacillus paracasei]|nr:UDP-N-acetylglucosamine--N-acetylmuramyl-(pentapeptide) pyrophosphoryl-undecaprenol N-acetylglucosamine transferase [Lacticaseibacillus paracasei]